MKLLIVRHADPDYSIDSLTETGWKEAKLLAQRLAKLDVKDFYVSHLGRARDTASLTLEKMNRQAVVCPWLEEFSPGVVRPDREKRGVAWDWLPADWTKEKCFFDRQSWYDAKPMRDGNVEPAYRWVTAEFDRLLSAHGYEREQEYYRVTRANRETIVLFCHFGVECVLLSHLLNISPMLLWHGTCAAPSSVTTVATEERREGIAYFRMLSFGDTAHLYVAGEQPSFAARFCETYDDWSERHD